MNEQLEVLKNIIDDGRTTDVVINIYDSYDHKNIINKFTYEVKSFNDIKFIEQLMLNLFCFYIVITKD